VRAIFQVNCCPLLTQIFIVFVGEIVGGADRFDTTMYDKAGDSLITNFGQEEWRDVAIIFSWVAYQLIIIHRNTFILKTLEIGMCTYPESRYRRTYWTATY
jgi:hypothetical protein